MTFTRGDMFATRGVGGKEEALGEVMNRRMLLALAVLCGSASAACASDLPASEAVEFLGFGDAGKAIVVRSRIHDLDGRAVKATVLREDGSKNQILHLYKRNSGYRGDWSELENTTRLESALLVGGHIEPGEFVYVQEADGAPRHAVTAGGAAIRVDEAVRCAKEGATASLGVSIAVDAARAERAVSLAGVPCGAKVNIMRVMANGAGSFAVLVAIENGPKRYAFLPPMTPVVAPPKETSFMDRLFGSKS